MQISIKGLKFKQIFIIICYSGVIFKIIYIFITIIIILMWDNGKIFI